MTEGSLSAIGEAFGGARPRPVFHACRLVKGSHGGGFSRSGEWSATWRLSSPANFWIARWSGTGPEEALVNAINALSHAKQKGRAC